MSKGLLLEPLIDEFSRYRLDQLRALSDFPEDCDILQEEPNELFGIDPAKLLPLLLGWVTDQKTAIQAAITASKHILFYDIGSLFCVFARGNIWVR